jgi:DNA-binding CsgD family transcriptional regulator
VLHDLGNILYDLGELPLAADYIEECVALLRREADDPRQLASAMLTQAVFLQEQDAFEAARGLVEEALSLYRLAGDRRTEALALAHLGSIALGAGEHVAARDRLGESIEIQRELGDAGGAAFVLERFAALAVAQGAHAGAQRLAGAAASLRELAGTPLPASGRAKLEQMLASSRRALGPADSAEAWRQGCALSLEEAVTAALAITDARIGQSDRLRALRGGGASVLTTREQEVAALIGRGLTNRQIGEQLVITEGTVASHVVHILNKLAFGSRAQVAVWARDQGLLDSGAGLE